MWKDAPSNIEQDPPVSPGPPVLDDDEVANVPDIALENDLQVLEDDIGDARGGEPDNPPDIGIPPEVNVTVNNPDKGRTSTFYIVEFPENLGAGAVLGEDVPLFERIWREQQENQSSRWGPFEDKDEWELAQWLVRNVGHKQTNDFLNLKIVSSHHLTDR
jgi:hypothetical protein